MKQLVSILESTDPRWNEATEAPLLRFIREPDVDVVTIFFEKLEEKKVEKKRAREKLPLKKEEKKQESAEEPNEDILMWDQLLDQGDGEGEDSSAGQADTPIPNKDLPSTGENEDGGYEEMYPDPFPDTPPAPQIEDTEKLIVLNEVVSHSSPDLYYFVKLKPTKLTNDNFLDFCVFGSAPDGDLSTLKMPEGK
jgi:hypothetical protein